MKQRKDLAGFELIVIDIDNQKFSVIEAKTGKWTIAGIGTLTAR